MSIYECPRCYHRVTQVEIDNAIQRVCPCCKIRSFSEFYIVQMTPPNKTQAETEKPREYWIDDYGDAYKSILELWKETKHGPIIHVIEYAYHEAVVAKLKAENKLLTKLIAKELSENDELGAEYIYVVILKDKLKELEAEITRLNYTEDT